MSKKAKMRKKLIDEFIRLNPGTRQVGRSNIELPPTMLIPDRNGHMRIVGLVFNVPERATVVDVGKKRRQLILRDNPEVRVNLKQN